MSDEMSGDDLAPLAQCFQALQDLVDRIGAQIGPGAYSTTEATIVRYRGEVYAAMDALGNAMHEFQLARPSPDRVAAARRLVVDPILRWSVTSPVFCRSQKEAGGQLGYHELVQLMRDKRLSGADAPALILNDYYVYSVSGEAFRNRLQLIGKRLHAEVLQRLALGYRLPRIVSLQYANGAALMPLAGDPEVADKVQITCLDGSAPAIRHAQRTLGPVFKGNIRFQKADAQRWLYGPDCQRETACIVYVVSLLEQRDAAAVVRILQGAHQLLREGGVLLAGCVTPNVPLSERTLRNWLLERDWIYRDEQECRTLLGHTPFVPDHVRFDYEPLHVSLLFTAQRTT
jgi:SAM-dependent methyltransferase